MNPKKLIMKIPENKIKSLRHIFYLKARENKSIRVTVTAFKQDEERGIKLFDLADIKNLAHLNKLLALEEFVRARVEMFDIKISETKPEKVYEYINEKFLTSNLKRVSEAEFEKQFEEQMNNHFREMELKRLKNENQELQNQIDRLKKKYRRVPKYT
jgi:hypothetical protein